MKQNFPDHLTQNAKKIRALITDIDGVMTDGKIIYTNSGDELKGFHVRDGLIVSHLRSSGILVGAITGRSSEIVERRLKELSFDFFYQGSSDKFSHFEQIKIDYKLMDEEIAYIGDDINDLPVLIRSGLSMTPANAPDYVKEQVDWVINLSGGEGVFRMAADFIMHSQGTLQPVIESYNR